MIRVGVLGCANIARRSLMPAFEAHPAFQLVALGSRRPEAAAAVVELYGCRATSYEDLVLSEDVDLIYCPLPTGLHYPWVSRCLANGKHVLCEKSLACSQEQGQELVSCARANGRFLMESFQFRFHNQNIYVKELLAQGKIGAVRNVAIRFGFPPFPDGAKNIRYSHELGGGALLDAGAYTAKAASFLLGEDLSVMAATSWTKPGVGVDLGGSAQLLSNDGVSVQTSWGFDNHYQCGYDIWGSKGVISTRRAFTAPPGFPAEVVVCTPEGECRQSFPDNHFQKLLTHVASKVSSASFEGEYRECLTQGRLVGEIARRAGIGAV